MKKTITYILLIVTIVLSAMFLLSKTNTNNFNRDKIVTHKVIIKKPNKVIIKKPNKVKVVKAPENIIYIQPLGDVKLDYIINVKIAIEDFYKTKCVVKEKMEFTNDILAKSKTRYDADKILSKFNSKENQLFLTEKDIACKSEDRHSNEWGIFGLGYHPGSTCIVSTFRLKKNVGDDTVIDRLIKVSLHEIGHNLGLDHCKNNKNCMMNDAGGTITQVDREWVWLCGKCRNFLKTKK